MATGFYEGVLSRRWEIDQFQTLHQRFFGLSVPQNCLVSILVLFIFQNLVPRRTHQVVPDILRLLLPILTKGPLLHIPLKSCLGFSVQFRNMVNTRVILKDADVLFGRLG